MKTTKQQRQAAFARYKASASTTPESMADLAVAVGAAHAAERDAWRDRFASDFAGTRAAMWAGHTAPRPNTPAPAATAGSGPAVAAASRATVNYPASWAGSVDAARRTPGIRTAATKVARAAARRVAGQVHVAGSGPAYAAQARAVAEAVTQQAQARTVDTFYDKSPHPSSFAAAQEAARQADMQRMAAEQKARGIG
jgi:hypothetical protein